MFKCLKAVTALKSSEDVTHTQTDTHTDTAFLNSILDQDSAIKLITTNNSKYAVIFVLKLELRYVRS